MNSSLIPIFNLVSQSRKRFLLGATAVWTVLCFFLAFIQFARVPLYLIYISVVNKSVGELWRT